VVRKRPARKGEEPSSSPCNQLLQQGFPPWARPPIAPAVDAEARSGAAFRAGAGLALLDAALRQDPPFSGALRQRLALRAATSCAALARHREDFSALRDAEHLSPGGARTSPAGRLHRFWRDFSGRPVEPDAKTLRRAADWLELPQDLDLKALAEALRQIAQGEKNPLAAAAQASAAGMKLFCDASPAGADVSSAGNRPHAEIWAFWLSDLMLAHRLGWESPLPMLATVIAHPSLRRGAAGRRPRPGEPGWAQAVACSYALAASEAFALAAELSRRSEKLLALAPKLRAKGAGRVIELLLSDDVVSPARAAKLARLSDRAARRLFDRLIELGGVRELSGRPNFRLYGL
ncbi:MAG: DUF1403 family protein, partial [Methylocystis sp.]